MQVQLNSIVPSLILEKEIKRKDHHGQDIPVYRKEAIFLDWLLLHFSYQSAVLNVELATTGVLLVHEGIEKL